MAALSNEEVLKNLKAQLDETQKQLDQIELDLPHHDY